MKLLIINKKTTLWTENKLCLQFTYSTATSANKTYLFPLKDNVSIYKNVAEQKKLAQFWFFTAHFGQYSFTNYEATRKRQWL